MDTIIHPIFKWLHVVAGIMWIGLLYFFNFVNTAFAPTMDGDTKKKVVPELMPRTLYWFRMGAAWTWGTGIVLLMVIYYHGGYLFDAGTKESFETGSKWGIGSFVMIGVTFLAVFAYDFLYKSSLASNVRLATIISFLVLSIIVYGMYKWAGFGYRGYNIHLGALFGTIMAFNVWFRIWPAQQKIITAIKNGDAPDGGLLSLAGLRSKHNTYMSIPLVWTMHNEHHAAMPGTLKLTSNLEWILPMVMVIIGWHIVFQLYKKSGTIKGF